MFYTTYSILFSDSMQNHRELNTENQINPTPADDVQMKDTVNSFLESIGQNTPLSPDTKSDQTNTAMKNPNEQTTPENTVATPVYSNDSPESEGVTPEYANPKPASLKDILKKYTDV